MARASPSKPLIKLLLLLLPELLQSISVLEVVLGSKHQPRSMLVAIRIPLHLLTNTAEFMPPVSAKHAVPCTTGSAHAAGLRQREECSNHRSQDTQIIASLPLPCGRSFGGCRPHSKWPGAHQHREMKRSAQHSTLRTCALQIVDLFPTRRPDSSSCFFPQHH